VVVVAALLILFTWRARRRHRALLATVEVIVLADVTSVHLGNSRDISIYLPPGYHNQLDQRYPVLYINDGQDMAALRLRETMARELSCGRIRPFIAVAIPANNDRLQEYGTAVAPNAQGFGRLAWAYACFVVETVRPLVNNRFRTLKDAEQTAFLGASLGGLSAFDIAWNHRDRFGTAGVFSGSFWWRAADNSDTNNDLPNGLSLSNSDVAEYSPTIAHSPLSTPCPRPGHLIAHETVRCSAYQAGFRVWFQTGTRDEVSDRDQNGVIDAIQDTLELIEALEERGYRLGRDIEYVEVRGGRHNDDTWSRVLPDFLQWAF
jgi:enterochelin esterase-like enzyme